MRATIMVALLSLSTYSADQTGGIKVRNSGDFSTAVSIASSGTSATTSTLQGANTVAVILTSLGTGGAVAFEASIDGTNYVSVNMNPLGGTGLPTSTSSATGSWQGDITGMQLFRVRATALTSGTITGTIKVSGGTGTQVVLTDPAPMFCSNFTPINISTATTTKIISLTSGKNTYICSFHLFSAGTQNAAWISGTKVTNECDTSTAGLTGGTTAASGYNFTAQTGIATSGGNVPIIATATTGKDVCIITSAAVQLSGVVNWGQY